MNKKLFYILIFTFSCAFLQAQQTVVSASIDTNSILIGEQAKIELSISYKVNKGTISIQLPQLYDTINEHIEIVHQSPIDTIIDKNDITSFKQTKQITITSFDSGYYAIPPFKFIVNKDTLVTEPILFKVNTVSVDTTKAIFDINKPLEEPFSFVDWLKDNWPWIAGGIILIAIIIFLIYYFKNKKPAPVKEEIIPDVPIHIITLQRLEEIKKQKLWQSGKVKQYHSEISEVLRSYLEGRYQIKALEVTTNEILHSLRLQNISQELMNKLSQTLVLADLVKFAKEKPLPNEHEISLLNTIEFVNSTKLIIVENKKDVN